MDSSRKTDSEKNIEKLHLCKIVQGKTAISPETPKLHEFRVSCDQPFENVGVAYAGPLYFKKKKMLTIVLEFQNVMCCYSRTLQLEQFTWNLHAT